jgi:hypothetical protein
MTHNNETNDANNTTPQDSHQAQRRQLLKRGALLAPVVLTLHARPAFAQMTNGSYGYCSYNVVNGTIQGQTGECWRTQQEARNNDVQE